MADLKISQLTGATTPLAGTEVLPIVQSGSTKQVSVANLTAGRSVSVSSLTASGNIGAANMSVSDSNWIGWGNYNSRFTGSGGGPINVVTNSATAGTWDTNQNYTFYVGNLIQGTAAKGVNFTANTPAAGMTSQLLNDYQEGTWTPAFVNGTFTYGFQSGFYTKVGRLVTVSALVTWSAKTGAGNLSITLPFTIRPSNYYRGGISLGNCNGLILNAGFTVIGSLDQSATSTDFYFLVSNAAAQQMTLNDIGSSGAIQFTATYMV